jgi:hypothetical protein
MVPGINTTNTDTTIHAIMFILGLPRNCAKSF